MVGNQYSPMSWKNQASLPQVLPAKPEAFFSKQASNSKDFLSKSTQTRNYIVFLLYKIVLEALSMLRHGNGQICQLCSSQLQKQTKNKNPRMIGKEGFTFRRKHDKLYIAVA